MLHSSYARSALWLLGLTALLLSQLYTSALLLRLYTLTIAVGFYWASTIFAATNYWTTYDISENCALLASLILLLLYHFPPTRMTKHIARRAQLILLLLILSGAYWLRHSGIVHLPTTWQYPIVMMIVYYISWTWHPTRVQCWQLLSLPRHHLTHLQLLKQLLLTSSSVGFILLMLPNYPAQLLLYVCVPLYLLTPRLNISPRTTTYTFWTLTLALPTTLMFLLWWPLLSLSYYHNRWHIIMFAGLLIMSTTTGNVPYLVTAITAIVVWLLP